MRRNYFFIYDILSCAPRNDDPSWIVSSLILRQASSHLFSCGTKRLFAMTTRRGLLRLYADRLVAYPTHKTAPREE